MVEGVLVFASRDSVHFAEAQVLAHEIRGQLVDRLSSSLEDLLLVARYKVVEPVVIVVLAGSRIIARIPRLVTKEQLLRDMASLT